MQAMRTHGWLAAALVAVLFGVGGAARADRAPAKKPQLRTTAGPTTGKLGNVASIDVPKGYSFVSKGDMPTLNKLTGNLPNSKDIGAILGDDFIVFFNWDPVGYVSDEEKDELDAEDLMDSFKESEEAANEARVQQGFDPMYIDGWQTAPYYDLQTNNLTWALRNRIGDDGRLNVNHEVRLLGRKGVMSAILVSNPDKLDNAVKELTVMLKGYEFSSGNKYAEFMEGDKVAAYGLTGLMLGGAAVLGAKTGLFAKLGKFLKVIVLGVIAAVGGAFKWLKARFRGDV